MNKIKNSRWTSEEETLLRQLKESQIKNNIVNWEEIANFLNFTFPKAVRTSKQCRQKYINHARLSGSQNCQNWSQQELLTFMELYNQFGPCWSYISTKLVNKSQNRLKNKFNNGVRKIAKILNNRQGDLYKHTKRSITTELLIAMIDFINKLQKFIINIGLTINLQSKFFSFRSQILKFSLLNLEPSSDQITAFVKKIKALNSKIRCFGIFKVKNRKNWKLSKKGLWAVCQYDKVINQEIQNMEEQYSNQKEMEKQRKTSDLSMFCSQAEQKKMYNFEGFYENFMMSYQDFDAAKLSEEIKQIIGGESQIFQFGDFFY